jgi:hypothetical protein
MLFLWALQEYKNLSSILDFIKTCKQDIEDYKPDALIFIDNSGTFELLNGAKTLIQNVFLLHMGVLRYGHLEPLER